ncbi:hypothetical protein ACTWP5_20285 [Streptomyces sp. 4N509B]|uniref:hypothetical protein n=1 Tax=Streptomyces sp. 4N509B TaxID=3457413 RepID=UPI003FD3DE09
MTASPRRVRITSPQTRIALSRRNQPAPHLLPHVLDGTGIAAETDPADHALYLRQRRLAVRTLCVLGAVVFGLSGLLGALPVLDRVSVLGIPASWLLLMTASYPLLLLIALLHVRRAEQHERAYAHHAHHARHSRNVHHARPARSAAGSADDLAAGAAEHPFLP